MGKLLIEPWFARDPAAFEEQRGRVRQEFPDLDFVDRAEDDRVLRGYYQIADAAAVRDRYLIEVELDNERRSGLFVVREIGGRISGDADRHMNEDGTACIVLPDAFWFEHPDGMDLVGFLDGPVRRYFVAQSLVERGEPWPGDEWPHGGEGIVAFYSDLLDVSEVDQIIDFLDVVRKPSIKSYRVCPCGSGRTLRDCHEQAVMLMRERIPSDVARRSRKTLRENGKRPRPSRFTPPRRRRRRRKR